MFRCKVCGWIHEGDAPPNECPSCGATGRSLPPDGRGRGRHRHRRAGQPTASSARVSTSTSTTPAGSACSPSSTPPSSRPSPSATGKRYPIYTGDPQWFSDNIPCMTACPSHTDISRYIALIADGRYADSLRAQPRAQRLPRLPRPHVRPPLRGRLPPQGGRRPDRHLLPEAGRRRLPRRNPARDSAAAERSDRRHHRRRRQRPHRRPPARPQGLQGHHLRALPGPGRRDVDRRAGVAPAPRRDHGRGRADHSTSASRSSYNTEVGKDITFQDLVDTLRRRRHLRRLPDRRRSSASPARIWRASSPACSSWRTSTSARRTSGSASASSPSAAASPRWTASAPCCAWAPSGRS